MAIAGIIIGSLGLVAPCMISILLPSLNRARETANRVKCASNMRSIGQAMIIYATSNRGYLPPDLAMVVPVGVKMDQFVCPSASDTPASNAAGLSTPGHLSYVYVYQGKPMSLRKLGPGSRAAVLYEPFTNHTDGTNILFADGHVEWLPRASAQPIIDQAKAGGEVADQPQPAR
jgi:prepilin-type processing-associated H-X9-DG protein